MAKEVKRVLSDSLAGLCIWARRTVFPGSAKALIPMPIRLLAWRIATSKSVFTIMDSRMYIPPQDRNQSLIFDRYEPEVAGRIGEILRPGMTFCDVGANIGVFTLLGARAVGPSGRVVAFEPVPANSEVLKRNIRLNGYENVLVIEKAVSDRAGTAQLHLSEFCGCHSLVPNPARALGKTVTVETVRLDEIDSLKSIDLLKIDAEGAEMAVLQGLGSRPPRHVILEMNIERLKSAKTSGDAFLKALRDLGFTKIINLDRQDGAVEPVLQEEVGSCNLHLSW